MEPALASSAYIVESRLARLISLILMPPVVAIGTFAILSSRLITQPLPAMQVLVVSSFFVAVVPSLYIALLLHRQTIRGGIDLVLAEERLRPYVVATVSCTIGTAVLIWLSAPESIWALVLAYALSGVLMALITQHWKISMHAVGTAMPVTALLSVFGTPALPVALMVPLVCWARVRARVHTVAQVAAGAVLGVGVAWLDLIVLLPRM